jgi:hypothetical protein
MAADDCEISTESEDAEGFAKDSTAGKLLPSNAPNRSCDSRSDRDDESEMGKMPRRRRRRRVEWENVETWDREVLEDGHILLLNNYCFLNNEQQFMREAGLSFVAGQKKTPTNLDGQKKKPTNRSKKLEKDNKYEATI